MARNLRTILVSMAVLCMCTALIVGGTYALFSEEEIVNNHLVAGRLDVGLTRIDYRECVIGDNGTLTEPAPLTKEVDLTKDGTALFNDENAAPGCWYQATVKVTNDGTTAFDYDMRILWNVDGKAGELEKTLASQIKITVTSDEIDNETHSVSFTLDKCADNVIDFGYMLKGADPVTFTILAEYVHDDNNNATMGGIVNFDIQVSALQKTKL